MPESFFYEQNSGWFLHIELRNEQSGEVVVKLSDEISPKDWSIEFV